MTVTQMADKLHRQMRARVTVANGNANGTNGRQDREGDAEEKKSVVANANITAHCNKRHTHCALTQKTHTECTDTQITQKTAR